MAGKSIVEAALEAKAERAARQEVAQYMGTIGHYVRNIGAANVSLGGRFNEVSCLEVLDLLEKTLIRERTKDITSAYVDQLIKEVGK